MSAEKSKTDFMNLLADTGALFFQDGLTLKDRRPTPYFVNIGEFFNKASWSEKLGEAFADMIFDKLKIRGEEVDIFFGPSYKGSSLANIAAKGLLEKYGLDTGFCYDRKEEKAHGDGSINKNLIVGARFFNGCKIYIVDDVNTSMKTKYDSLEKIAVESKRLGIKTKVVVVGIAVDRRQVSPVYDPEENITEERGEDPIKIFKRQTGIPVDSIVSISEAIFYLEHTKRPIIINGEKRPIDEETFNKFINYMVKYGVSL